MAGANLVEGDWFSLLFPIARVFADVALSLNWYWRHRMKIFISDPQEAA